MAAAEEEGSQSENKNDDPLIKGRGKPFSTMHQEIEGKLLKPGISYEDRVGIILSGWDHLAGAATTGQLPFATFLYKWTLQLVLQGEWPKLEKIVKTRLKATLQRCIRDPLIQTKCRTLLPLVTDPWGHQTLKAIIAGSYVSDEEADQYILEETWPVVRERINTLVESRCEKLALSVLKVCMRSIRSRSSTAEMLLNSQEDHNHFVDLYFVLLYKFQRKQFLDEVRQMDLMEGVDHVRRLLAQQEKGKVWKHRLKIAEYEMQIFLTSCIVKPYDKVFWCVFSEWCNVMRDADDASEVLIQMVRKYIQLAESSQHIYCMGSILHHKFGEMHAALVTELLIRALTVDMNSLEGVKVEDKEGSGDEQTRLEHQMADGFMDLATVFEQHHSVARECVLTAFSLHPTHSRLEILNRYSDHVESTESNNTFIPEDVAAINTHGGGDVSHSIDNTEGVSTDDKSSAVITSQSDDSISVNCDQGMNRESEIQSQASPLPPTHNDGVEDIGTKNQSEVMASLEPCQKSNTSESTMNSILNISKNNDSLNFPNPTSLSDTLQSSKQLDSEIGCEMQCEAIGLLETSNVESTKLDNDSPFSEKLPVNLEDPSERKTEDENESNSQTKDIWAFVDETGNGFNKGQCLLPKPVEEFVDETGNGFNNSQCLPKPVEDLKPDKDVDSMDGFLATTEGLIEQLNQENENDTQKTEECKPPSTENEPHFDILTDPQAVLSKEKLGISKELCDDLAVVLSSPRWQVLSWLLEKPKLFAICEKYLRDSDSAKNVTKELKFLNIDYSQFKHLPSTEEGDEYCGIEKGYEHFIDNESDIDDEYSFEINPYNSSSGSEGEGKRNRGCALTKRGSRRGRPPVRARYMNSDSDSTGRSKGYMRATTSVSESEDSEFESASSRFDMEGDEFEGKRVTAISCNDRRKRLRIDATTGKVRSRVNHLRLYRHKPLNKVLDERGIPSFVPFPSVSARTPNPPKQGTLNVSPSVVLTHFDRSSMSRQMQNPITPGTSNSSNFNFATTVKAEVSKMSDKTSEEDSKKALKPTPFQKGRHNWNWRYAGYVISRPQKDNTLTSSVPITNPTTGAVRCSYRTREGRLVTLNTRNYAEDNAANVEYLRKLSGSPSKYEETFAKFLIQQKSDLKEGKSAVTITRKSMPIENSFDYLKRQGTSVIYKKSSNTTALANAQKNVLNRIMSPENSGNGLVGRTPSEPLPVRAIAMPVSHNPPNLPPSDKTNPTGLNRVLPKGTTVVRRPKSDTGAGPSGLNNGGADALISSRSRIVRSFQPQPRPTVTITPSNNFLGQAAASASQFPTPITSRSNFSQSSLAANVNPLEGASTTFPGNVSAQAEGESFSPLASATVVGSVSQNLSPRLNSNTSSPGEMQGSCFVNLNPSRNFSNLSSVASFTTTTTVATLTGEARAPSMLETLLRDRSTSSSPLVLPLPSSGSPAPTATTTSIPDPIVASPAITGNSVAVSSLSEAISLVTSHSNLTAAAATTSNTDVPVQMSVSGTSAVSNVVDNSVSGSVASNINLGVSGMPVIGSSIPTTVLSASLPGSVISSGVGPHITVSTGGTSTTADPSPAGMHQLLLPAQFIQVQGSDGSTGLGIVHSGSLDLRLPPGTRVIKSSTSNMRPSAPVAMSQASSRPLNVLHNVKIVQNRQIVRTVVVPHSVALQSLGAQQTAQLVALGQGSGTSNNSIEPQTAPKISSTQLQKMLGHNVVPGGLVIRAVRPPDSVHEDASIPKPPATSSIIQHTSEVQQSPEKEKEQQKPKIIPLQSQEEGLAERLSRHYLKTALLASTSTQSVGTQTQTTAVKPVTGQLVNQVVMNHLRGIGGTASVSSVPIGSTQVVASAVPPASGLSPLSLGSSNAVSSETLEQLREFESVFEKVSNKSVKENETTAGTNTPSFPTTSISSEESMIAAQLLSMANDTPTVSTASSYVYTIPATSSENTTVTISSAPAVASAISTNALSGARLGEGTFITIPSSTQAGTLILVNPSVATSGAVTMTSGVQTTQPPPAASPALSSTSSHSSIASSPSSTSSKSKSKSSKVKAVTPPSAPVTPTKPKSPPPPKAPPKPAVAKPQVEESDEIKSRIQAILDQYKQDLANTPQPQPAPRNRKNCPPPKNEGKSSNKKKSQAKKPDGTSNTSPSTSDSGHLPSVSPSPAPLAVTPSGEDSEGSMGGTSGTSSQFPSQEDKAKSEDSISPQILQGVPVVVSNVKVDNSSLGNNLGSLPHGRVVQLIRHGSKVTAITTRQPYQKNKAGLASGGPPPNVTIQGRINMNELMESHLASLLAGGTSTINQSSALITKLIQAQQQQQQQQSPSIQQVVVQTSGGMGQQVIQQVSLQPVITTHTKAQQVQGTIISGGATIPDSSNQRLNSPIKTPTHPQPSPVMSLGVSPSPGTPQQRASSPSTPSPAPELPSTPSSFPTAEEDSNSSDDSNDGTTAAPLPPFFTLTKQFMVPQQSQRSLSDSSQISLTPTSEGGRPPSKLSSESTSAPSAVRASSFLKGSFAKGLSCPSQGGSKAGIAGAVMLAHSAPPSPLVVAPGDNVIDMSPVSGPSSLEGSPSILSHRLPLVSTAELRSSSLDSVKSDLSVEEVQIPPSPATLTKQLQNAYMTEAALSPTVSQSHLSSGSSYSSPTTVQDIQFAGEQRVLSPNLGHTPHTYSLARQSSTTSSLSNASNCSASHNNPSMENNSLACLSSPSGDVYLDQAGVSLGLDTLPLVEGRPQSPSLSDLVPAVPLLSWSPRSADSIMGQSPSLNEALSGNMTLDVHHSEDSLCDSSTGFPGLFAMDGDGGSVSSSSSDDILSVSNNNPRPPVSSSPSTSAVFSVAPSQPSSGNSERRLLHGVAHSSFGKRLPNNEQDHTITSTRSEDMGHMSSTLDLPQPGPGSDEAELLIKQDDSNSGSNPEEPTWKFAALPKSNSNMEMTFAAEDSSGSTVEGSNRMPMHHPFLNQDKKGHKRVNSEAPLARVKKEIDSGARRRKSQRQRKDSDRRSPRTVKDEVVHNGYEEKLDNPKDYSEEELLLEGFQKDNKMEAHVKNHSDDDATSVKGRIFQPQFKLDSEGNLVEDEKNFEDPEGKDPKPETEERVGRLTRGSKRRSDSDFPQEEKRSRSSRSRRSETASEDLCDEDKTTSGILEDASGGAMTRTLRGRHNSGTSDSSSNYSVDRVSTPGLQDSPVGSGSGGSRRRKRRGSHDSSVSSRDGSPLTVLLSAQQEGSGNAAAIMQSRRSSSRDHAKKTRCRCCVDHSSSGSSSGRRSSGRMPRGSGPPSSSS